jgi:cytochrome o ubiquinol oxidase subunit 1
LEWSTTSPPPHWNFALLPQVVGPDQYWRMKYDAEAAPPANPTYEPITVPKNSPLGFFVAFFAVILGFALIWHIWWMAIIGLFGILAVTTRHAWRIDLEEEISAAELMEHEQGTHKLQSVQA